MLPQKKSVANPYSLSHVPDDVLMRDLSALAEQDRNQTAELEALLAEVDARGLHLPGRELLEIPAPYAEIVEVSPGQYLLHGVIDRETHDKFLELQELLRDEIPSGDFGEILRRALDCWIHNQE